MKREDLLEQLALRPLCADGAMGTQLFARGLASGDCGMLWNVERSAEVSRIHEAYHAAGCDLLTTNSFGGSAFALARHGQSGRVAELNQAAARIARAAAGEQAWVLGDVGPFGDFLEPLGDMTAHELRDLLHAQIEALLAGGADAVLIETMSDPNEAVVGIEAAKSCTGEAPVIVTYAFQKSGPCTFHTMMGTDVAAAVGRAIEAGADIVGANCGTSLGLDDYAELGKQLVAAADGIPVIVQPNAGAPRVEREQTIYEASAGQMAESALQLFAAGVRIVGGCCGTTPAHLAAMAKSLANVCPEVSNVRTPL